MPNKPMPSQTAERIIYILAVILAPSIPLFFLYSKNAAQGLLFRHFLIMGAALAVISLIIYLPISKFLLRRRRTVIIIALFWAAFWFFKPLSKIISRGNAEYSQVRVVVYLLIIIAVIGLILRFTSMNRLVANTIAGLLCLLFVYNFVPSAFTVLAGEKQRALNDKTGILPYEIKTKFDIDLNLPHPNIYWLHMDGMIGFDMVERYFKDSQTELKKDLGDRGFVINKNARLEAGYTRIAMPAMLSPVFFDSYLADIFSRVAQLTRAQRENAINDFMTKDGFSLNDDIFPKIEILKALFDVGYINIGNSISLSQSQNMNIFIEENYESPYVTIGLDEIRKAINAFNILVEFKELITDASALSIVKLKTDDIFEKRRPVANPKPLLAYQEMVDKYINGYSDSNISMAYMINVMKYVTLTKTPHFVYFMNGTTHTDKIIYDEYIGYSFYMDENGNYFKEWLDDPFDVHLYLPQHKYAIKQMIAQIDTILENDPDAVIILQGDHGIHCYGYNNFPYDFGAMSARGYNLEDQLNLNLSVISAVRIPPKYGKLSQPLEPLDIARYLVNNFVGKGNYDYLYYKEEGTE